MFMNEVPNSADLPALIVNELRDIYGIKYRKDKKHKNAQLVGQHKVFNVPLKSLEFTEVKLSNGSVCRVPKFVSDACTLIMENVEVEGLFRKAGSAARQKEIREKIESGISIDSSFNAIDVANILKYFFRELPEPLMPPGNFQESILRCLLCNGTPERRVSAIKMVCLLLPTINLNTLVYFMQFLNFVSLYSSTNKMSIKNLAIILTPGLMPMPENIGQRLASHVQVMEILIEHAHEIGLVPEALLIRMPNFLLSESTMTNQHNFTMSLANARRSMGPSFLEVPQTDVKKKKKRRSGSLTRMFNGLRKIVGAIGSSENLDETHELLEVPTTPCLNKSKKRKVLEPSAFSAKKKKDVMSMLPNGGILPSTPMCSKTPPANKKSRLSLGGKRYAKNGSASSSSSSSSSNQHEPAKTSHSIIPGLERRWSVVGSSWNRNKKGKHKNIVSDSAGPSSEAMESSDKVWENFSVLENAPSVEKAEEFGFEMDDKDDIALAERYQSEYDEIKDRVTAIETRISKEFNKIQSSMLNNSMDSVDIADHLNGPEKVLEKFSKTLEETEMMNSTPSTEQLAKHLSRGLNIRRSAEHKVIRSPSARKIGSIRRRSQENVRLTRNRSWHLDKAPQPIVIKNYMTDLNCARIHTSPLATSSSQTHLQKANLRRGRPNTVQTGLRQIHASPTNKTADASTTPSKFAISSNYPIENIQNVANMDLQNENWICADKFFDDKILPTFHDDDSMNTPKGSGPKSVPIKQSRKKLNMNDAMMIDDSSPKNVRAPSAANTDTVIDNMKTPMLPPRLPVIKKTPGSMLRTASHQMPATFVAKSHLTPLWQQEQQQFAGRASIARLRSQNAGMVMAKAKLFDGLVIEPREMPLKSSKSIAPKISHTHFVTNTNQTQKNRNELESLLRTRINNANSRKSNSAPRRHGTPNNKNSPSSVQRRQNLRASRHTPIKNSPANLISSADGSNRIIRNLVSVTGGDCHMDSPMSRRTSAVDVTPHVKRALMNKRRIIRTPQGKRKAIYSERSHSDCIK